EPRAVPNLDGPEQLEPGDGGAQRRARHAQAFGERSLGRQASAVRSSGHVGDDGVPGLVGDRRLAGRGLRLTRKWSYHCASLCAALQGVKRARARETELEAEVRLGPAGQSIACRASAYASMDSPKQQSGRVTQACICVIRLYGLIIRIIKSRVSASARTPSPDSRPSEPAPRPHRRGLGGAGSRGRTGPPRPRELEDGASWRRRAPERPCGRVPTRRGRCGSARASLTAMAAGKRVTVEYFAVLREQRAVASETVGTSARTAR